MTTYYAVCNVNGPISRQLEAETIDGAVAQFEAAVEAGDTQGWIDQPATDAEDDLGIDGTDMGEGRFDEALEAEDYTMVRDLSSVVCGQGPTMRSCHIADGWALYGPNTAASRSPDRLLAT